MFMAEGMHPSARRAADARLLAGVYNGPMRPRGASDAWKGWRAADFFADNAWSEPVVEPLPVTSQEIAEQVAQLNARFEK